MPCFPIGRITDLHPISVFPIVSFAVVQNRRQVLQVVYPSFSPLIVERHLTNCNSQSANRQLT